MVSYCGTMSGDRDQTPPPLKQGEEDSGCPGDDSEVSSSTGCSSFAQVGEYKHWTGKFLRVLFCFHFWSILLINILIQSLLLQMKIMVSQASEMSVKKKISILVKMWVQAWCHCSE